MERNICIEMTIELEVLTMKSSFSSVIIYLFDENQVDNFYGLLFNEIDIVKE